MYLVNPGLLLLLFRLLDGPLRIEDLLLSRLLLDLSLLRPDQLMPRHVLDLTLTLTQLCLNKPIVNMREVMFYLFLIYHSATYSSPCPSVLSPILALNLS